MIMENPRIERLLSRMGNRDELKRATIIIRLIQERVAKHYGFTVKQLLSKARPDDLVWARHVAMYMAHECNGHTKRPAPGLFQRTEGSYRHAHRKVDAWRRRYPKINDELTKLEKKIAP